MEIEEMVKLLIMFVVILILVGAFILLFSGKGADILSSVKDLLRFGR